jgi:hypothetical protein
MSPHSVYIKNQRGTINRSDRGTEIPGIENKLTPHAFTRRLNLFLYTNGNFSVFCRGRVNADMCY